MKSHKTVQTVGEYATLTYAASKTGITYWRLYRLIERRQVATLKVGQTLLVKIADVREAMTER